MNPISRSDLNHFIRHLVEALQPVAKAQSIDLAVSTSKKPFPAAFEPSSLAKDITQVISRAMEYLPKHSQISVKLEPTSPTECFVIIACTGIDLSRNAEISCGTRYRATVSSVADQATMFSILVDLDGTTEEPKTLHAGSNGYSFPDYYAEIGKRLRSYFTRTDNVVAALTLNSPRDAAFLRKVHALILQNLENNQFDANHLSVLLNMSRTQLFRRLKKIIRQSPGAYIRSVRLQQAKELFETTDLRISEVAFKTGFETASHFTKVFYQQYGLKPSFFCRNMRATNG